MWKIGSVMVPTSAVVLLSTVSIMFVILILMLMCLNKVCCFANCEMPSIFLVDDSAKLLTDSDSDDSDEDIFSNYSHIEKSVLTAGSRKPSNIDSSKEDSFLEHWEKNTLNDLKVSGRSNKGSKKIALKKTAVLRINVVLDSSSSKLKIEVIQLIDLTNQSNKVDGQSRPSASDVQQVSVYQVHCSVLPAKKHRFKTKLKQGPDPMFDETFYIHKITTDEAASMSLRLRMYTSQRSVMVVVGQCLFNMDSVDLTTDSEYNLTLTEPGENDNSNDDDLSFTGSELLTIKSTNTDGFEECPELELGLSHNSSTGRLTVEIVRGVGLSTDKNNDYYVKLSLFSTSGSELSHAKTSLRKNTIAPIFRESFMFQVALFQLNEVTLMISVFAKKSIHRKNILGWLALGYKSSGEEEISHWNEIRQGNSNQVLRCHRLHQNPNTKKLLE